jgi:hypothetical protein
MSIEMWIGGEKMRYDLDQALKEPITTLQSSNSPCWIHHIPNWNVILHKETLEFFLVYVFSFS